MIFIRQFDLIWFDSFHTFAAAPKTTGSIAIFPQFFNFSRSIYLSNYFSLDNIVDLPCTKRLIHISVNANAHTRTGDTHAPSTSLTIFCFLFFAMFAAKLLLRIFLYQNVFALDSMIRLFFSLLYNLVVRICWCRIRDKLIDSSMSHIGIKFFFFFACKFFRLYKFVQMFQEKLFLLHPCVIVISKFAKFSALGKPLWTHISNARGHTQKKNFDFLPKWILSSFDEAAIQQFTQIHREWSNEKSEREKKN